MKQMFDISEKLIAEKSDEIYGVKTIHWEDSSWKQLSLVNDEEVISLSHAKVHVFSDSVLCLGKGESEPYFKCCLGRIIELVQKFITIQSFGHNWWWATGIRVEYFPQDSPHCSPSTKSKSSCQKWANSQKNSQDGSSSCLCSTTSHGDLKSMNRNAN